jgi:hypothetical protein
MVVIVIQHYTYIEKIIKIIWWFRFFVLSLYQKTKTN